MLLTYLRYFFYLAYHWNIAIAWHIIFLEIKGERKYGIKTTGADELKKLSENGIDTSHATIYMPASYDLLEDIFQNLTSYNITHFIDMGCGKGRVLCVASFHGIYKVTGVDLSKEFCEESKQNLALVKQRVPELNYAIYNNDAFYFNIPKDADCIFFFNPFDEIIMSGVVENITISLEKYPRHMTIVYLNPMAIKYFTDAGFTKTYYTKKMNYLEGCILTNQIMI